MIKGALESCMDFGIYRAYNDFRRVTMVARFRVYWQVTQKALLSQDVFEEG